MFLSLQTEQGTEIMEINFEKEYLRELYEDGKTSDKKHRFQFFPINSLRYEVLKGDKAGISSIRVNDQYRIEFTVKQISYETVVTICNILELSNHYK